MKLAALLLPFLFAIPVQAQRFYTYLLDLGPDYVELAWGTVDGVNTIGRTSASHGPAIIYVAGRTISSRTVPRWAPDSGSIAFDHDLHGSKAISVISIESGKPPAVHGRSLERGATQLVSRWALDQLWLKTIGRMADLESSGWRRSGYSGYEIGWRGSF